MSAFQCNPIALSRIIIIAVLVASFMFYTSVALCSMSLWGRHRNFVCCLSSVMRLHCFCVLSTLASEFGNFVLIVKFENY